MPAEDEPLVWVRRDGELTVVVVGEFDLHGVDQVLRETKALLAERPAMLAVDASRVTYMDSAALACLLECEARAQHADVQFRLSPASPAVRRVVRLAGLEYLLGE